MRSRNTTADASAEIQALRKKSFDLDQLTIMMPDNMPIAGPYTAAIILCAPSTEC